MKRSLIILCALLAIMRSAFACEPMQPCRVGDIAEYRVYPPSGWDGKKPIGAIVFIHGHRSSAMEMINYRELSEAVHALGFMLVAPQGLNESWSTPGSPGAGRRDEIAAINMVMDDLAKHFPIDPQRLIASGFSQGASVVWEIACRGDGRFRAFLPVAGVWWQPMPTECPAPRRALLHIHGTDDLVMPMAGRNLRDRWRQGNVMDAFGTMKRLHACPSEPSRQQMRGALECRFHENCGSNQPQALCLHKGDHHTNPAWFLQIRDWLEAALVR